MTHHTSFFARGGLLAVVIGAPLLLGAGALGMYLYLRPPRAAARPDVPAAAAAPARAPASARAVELTLAPDALSRAGIQTSEARAGSSTRELTVPGVVEPNTYRQLLVAAAAGGQVRSVSGELGAQIRQGQTLATIHSPAFAEAQQVYLLMQAELVAAHQSLARLEGLVKIGAASRQELDLAQVEHARHSADVEGARATLLFLGLTPDRIASLNDASRITPFMTVVAPSEGVVTRRLINPGQYIEAAAELFTLADLSTIWIVADLFERDVARVREGSRATMTSPAFPGEVWHGVVTYIDTQVAPETRTARLRVETLNPGRRLRLGMYVDVVVRDTAPGDVIVVPKSAVQTIGNQSVVYIADASKSGHYVERAVGLGRSSGDYVDVLAGLGGGERVVTSGSYFLRAERDRLGLPPPAALDPPAPTRQADQPVGRVAVTVTDAAFVPDRVSIPAGQVTDLVFTRTVEKACATEVVIPSLKIRKPLPLNRPVVVRLPPRAAGEIAFACGMNMLKGVVVVR